MLEPEISRVPDPALADRLENLLPQTQCTKCAFPDCRAYAVAMASGDAAINQCPPGGAEGIARLAHALGKPIIPLDPLHGRERPRPVALIDEAICMGCNGPLKVPDHLPLHVCGLLLRPSRYFWLLLVSLALCYALLPTFLFTDHAPFSAALFRLLPCLCSQLVC